MVKETCEQDKGRQRYKMIILCVIVTILACGLAIGAFMVNNEDKEPKD